MNADHETRREIIRVEERILRDEDAEAVAEYMWHEGRRDTSEGRVGTSKMHHIRYGGGQKNWVGIKCNDIYL